MSLIENLEWRHAVKAYDASKKVSDENITKIVEAARLAPTSSGLQPFNVIVISNQALKEKLIFGSMNPDCMRDCSHILVFAAWNNYTAERIDAMYDFTSKERGLAPERLKAYADRIKEVYLNQSEEQNFNHIAKQTYIALGLALAQAAELKIDSTPAEGFNNSWVDEVLGLEKLGLKSVTLMYVGYSNPEKDWMASMKKVRRPMKEFVIYD